MKLKKSQFSQPRKKAAKKSEIHKNVAEIHIWLRNLEQQLSSLNGRLGAVEKRITNSSSTNNHLGKTSLNEDENKIEIKSLPIQKIIIDQIKQMDEQIEQLTDSLTHLKEESQSFKSFKNETVAHLANLNAEKKRQNIMTELGNKIFSVELSGIIGGSICFMVAGLLLIDLTEIIYSPWFLFGIGSVLMSTTLLRSKAGNSVVKKITKSISNQSNKTTIHHSDSTS